MNAELSQDALVHAPVDGTTQRRAAVRIADQLGRENPHQLDDLMPKLAGRELAQEPAIAAGVLELLDVLGLHPDRIRRRK